MAPVILEDGRLSFCVPGDDGPPWSGVWNLTGKAVLDGDDYIYEGISHLVGWCFFSWGNGGGGMYLIWYRDGFLRAVKSNTRKYYWTGTIVTRRGITYEFGSKEIVKGSGYISRQC